ncbi:MAG: SURF1 family protein [Methylococcales symbiont of Hymedesmia sp. n. MRB-2018]|nr:MAG: SURF1 family protein [Methylococcales symbiont of Hymedesmia sp. n. MRB-2018]
MLEFVRTRYRFSILPVILYVFFLIVLFSLGFWQLGRAEEKRLFLDKQQLAGSEEAISLEVLVNSHALEYRHRKIELTGVYDSQHQFLIDNQIVDGKVGYFILTPFKVKGISQSVLINRGWLPLNKDRQVLPDVSIAVLKNTLMGKVNQFPSVGLKLAGAEIPTEGWPSVIQIVDSQVLSKKLTYPLFSLQIELDPKMNEGYLRKWKEIKIMQPEKHIAYALQWFGLAITLTFLFIRFSRTINE